MAGRPMNSPYSYDELQGAVPDPNPLVDCQGCGRRDSWQNIKDDWQHSSDPDVPMLCTDCQTTERRAEENTSITEWSE